MSEADKDKIDEAAPDVKARPTKRASEEKWGREVMDLGFLIVPSLLLRAQRKLHITAQQLAVLMHLADFWWHAGKRPFPAKKKLADRIGLGPRQVQRCIAALEVAGLVERVARSHPVRGKISNEYDLSGLVQRLKEIEPQFREVEENAKRERERVARPGLRRGRSGEASKID